MVTWSLFFCLCLGVQVVQEPQGPASRPTSRKNSLDHVKVLLERWLDKEQRSESLRSEVVEAIAAVGARAMRHLAGEAARARDGEDRSRARALDSVICHVGLHWLDRVKKSKMIYAGQYSPLAELQPTVGDFYLMLVINTPQWFPDNRRIEVVPAIRDLYPKSPGDAVQEQIKQIARNEDIEPLNLRAALKYALAQWGDRSLVKERINELTREAQSQDSETSMLALKALADVHYQIRDYLTAARMHTEFLAKAEAEDYYRVPADYYNAACCMSLSGNVHSALDLLDRCLKLNNSDRVDESVRLHRDLFDHDPEIRAVRKTKRFRELVSAAFPAGDAKKK
jgi:tetratricopeptide (TPR) repeat protein